MDSPKSNEVLLICIDTNTSMGVQSQAGRNNQVLGLFGVNCVNDAGRVLFDLLNSKGICSAATFFKKPAYATWRNPRSRKCHELHHVLIPSKDLSCVSDSGVSKPTVKSDHDPLQINIIVLEIYLDKLQPR